MLGQRREEFIPSAKSWNERSFYLFLDSWWRVGYNQSKNFLSLLLLTFHLERYFLVSSRPIQEIIENFSLQILTYIVLKCLYLFVFWTKILAYFGKSNKDWNVYLLCLSASLKYHLGKGLWGGKSTDCFWKGFYNFTASLAKESGWVNTMAQ